MNINAERLWRRIEELGAITEQGKPYTRRSFSSLHRQGREWLRGQFQEAGLDIRVDAGGNLIGRLPGEDSSLPRLGSGSHTDTVPAGGRFDGIAGVLAALEVAHAYQDQGVRLKRDFEVIDFLAEEPSEYGLSRVGSRALTGDLSAAMLAYECPAGTTLAEGLAEVGGDPAALDLPLLRKGEFAAFVELHIEQGPVLEKESLPIGIVTNIVGITRMDLSFSGQADHSGTTPMHIRKDALVAAARTVSVADEQARAWLDRPEYVVATVGKLDVEPNGANVVPGRVDMTLEVRSSSDSVAQSIVERVCEAGQAAANQLGVAFASIPMSFSPAAACDAGVQQAIEAACRQAGTRCKFMASGAGHDAACMTKLCPAGMIFIPCLNGRSHCPEEWASKEQLAIGAQTLHDAIQLLDLHAEGKPLALPR